MVERLGDRDPASERQEGMDLLPEASGLLVSLGNNGTGVCGELVACTGGERLAAISSAGVP